MLRAVLVVLVGLVGWHHAAAEEPIVDQCSKMCMRYWECVQNEEMGKPEMKTCIQPSCNCGPKPVGIGDGASVDVPEPKMCEGGPCPKAAPIIDDIISRCDTMCMSYSKCRAEGSSPCMMPAECKCFDVDMPKIAVKSQFPFDMKCITYWLCRRASMAKPNPSPACVRPKQCKMAARAEVMPCWGLRCPPKDDSNMPLYNFCNVQCNIYKVCRGEKNLSVPCIRPSGCMCEEIAPMPVEEGKSKMLISPIHQCTEPCKEYWQCRIGSQDGGIHVEKPHLSCPRPSGCVCSCMAAGVCDMDDVSKINSRVIEPVPAAERCPIQYCAQYWNCQVERLGRPDKQLLNCLKPRGCRCECLDEGICLREHFIPDDDLI